MAQLINFLIYKYRYKIGIPEQDAKRLEAALEKALQRPDSFYMSKIYIRKYTTIAILIKQRRKIKPHTRL
jgi:hypothetical protein